MTSKSTQYEELEGLASENTQLSIRPKLFRGFCNLIDRLMQASASGGEPRIREVHIKNGFILFNAYDPATGMKIRAASEEELRTWLEHRRHSLRRGR